MSQHIQWSHWFHIHVIFSSCFYLIIVTNRNSVFSCEHDPSYQERSQNNLVKSFFVLYGEVLTGFKHNFKRQLPKVFYKKNMFLKISQVAHRKTLLLESLFNKFAGLQTCCCFYVNIAKSLKTSVLKDVCERLLLNLPDSKET